MRGLSILVILLIAFYLIGCANTAMVEDAKRETEYRKSLENYGKDQKPVEAKGKTIEREVLVCDEIHSTIKKEVYQEIHGITLEDKCHWETRQEVEATPIEMPQEWFDQWDKESQLETEVEQAQIEFDLGDFELPKLPTK